MPCVLITGASRGIGLEFARQYAQAGWHVLATCRSPERATHLQHATRAAGDRAAIHPLDVEDFASIERLAQALVNESIDLLINNAGIMEPREANRIGQLAYPFWERVLRVNTFAAAKMAQGFLEQVARSERKCIVTITSLLASIDINRPGSRLAAGDLTMYRTSKAAANMLVRNLAADLRGRSITAVSISPGHVRTDMGGPNAPLSVEESVTGMRRVIDRLDLDHSGRFFLHNGEEVPW